MKLLGIEQGIQRGWKDSSEIIDKSKLGNWITPEQYGAKAILGWDNYEAFSEMFENAPENSIIFLSGGRYEVSDTILINKTLCLLGVGATIKSEKGSMIYRTNPDKPAIKFAGITSNFLNFGSLSHLKVGGVEGVDFMQLEYILGGYMSHFLVNGNTLNAHVRMKCVQDMVIIQPFLRHSGGDYINNEGLLVFDPPELDDPILGTQSINNVNDIRLFGGHFEHGMHHVKSLHNGGAGRNNSIVFTNTKFESKGGEFMFDLDYVDGFHFTDCRYTSYKKGFKISNSKNIKITGIARCITNPMSFGEFENIENLKIDVQGQKAGKITRKSNVRTSDIHINESSTETNLRDESLMGAESNMDYLTFFAHTQQGNQIIDSDSFSKNSLLSTSIDNAPILRFKPSVISRHRDGLTFWFKAQIVKEGFEGTKSYEVRAITPATSTVAQIESLISVVNVSTSMGWFFASISPDKIVDNTTFIQVNNTITDGAKLKVDEFYVENQYVSTAIPSNGNWEKGAMIRFSQQTTSGEIGAYCVTAGTPGIWKSIIGVNKDKIAIDNDGTYRIATGSSIEGIYELSVSSPSRKHVLKFSVSSQQFGTANVTVLSDYALNNQRVFVDLKVVGSADGTTRSLYVTIANRNISNGTYYLTATGIGQSTLLSLMYNPTDNTSITNKYVWIKDGNILLGTAYNSFRDSSILTLESVTQGFLPPRLTTSQRDNIINPAQGLMIYNTTVNKMQTFNGSIWETLNSN